MRLLTLLVMVSVAGSSVLEGQVDYNVRLGVTWAGPLLRDRIVGEIEVQQKLAPTLALGASLPIAPRYQAGVEVGLATSGYRAEEDGTSTDVGTLRTGSITLGLHGPITTGLRWRAGTGLLSYWPAEDQGMFLRGGTTKFLAGAGADYRRAILPNWEMMAALRYDFHRFNTEGLEARGFSQSRGIHRIAVTVGLARAAR